ncbi:MAG: response regulator transcription factor [Acidobacteriota bacterium]
MTEPISILIVDDHAVVRQGVISFLSTQTDINVVGEAASGAEAIKACIEYAPDVVLMDLLMPNLDGVEATRQIRQVSPRTQIIILTSYHEDKHILPAIQAGALSYLLKDVSPQELVEAVRKAARQEATLHPRVASHIMAGLCRNEIDTEDTLLTYLSKREIEVLQLIAEGLSNAEIAQRLFISEKTVKSHVSNVLGKLHLADRTQAAVYAWRNGLVSQTKTTARQKP